VCWLKRGSSRVAEVAARQTAVPPLPHCCLVNLGNTCYLNSVIQALRRCDGFASSVSEGAGLAAQSSGTTALEPIQQPRAAILHELAKVSWFAFVSVHHQSFGVALSVLSNVHFCWSLVYLFLFSKRSSNWGLPQPPSPLHSGAIASPCETRTNIENFLCPSFRITRIPPLHNS
jgi:hypothetical protein